MSQHASESDNTSLEEREAQIVRYLTDHSDFFERHPALLRTLQIPHESGAAVSLIERQVESLREQVHHYQSHLEELVNVARENEALQERMHRLTLALIDAASFEEVMNALEDELHDDFKADAMELRLFSNNHLEDHLLDDKPEHIATFEQFFAESVPICGPLQPAQLNFIFGTEGDEIASTALIPLKNDGVLGLLAIGSRDPNRFAAHQGTQFLMRLGEVIGRTLQAVSLPGI